MTERELVVVSTVEASQVGVLGLWWDGEVVVVSTVEAF
jgi:hypothetical protein